MYLHKILSSYYLSVGGGVEPSIMTKVWIFITLKTLKTHTNMPGRISKYTFKSIE